MLIEPVKRDLTEYIDMVDAWLAGLQEKFTELDSFTDIQKRRARYNGQIIVMRAAIEDFTGISGILIEVNFDLSGNFFYLESEANDPSEFNYLSLVSEDEPQYLNLESEGSQTGSFTILVPQASFNQEVEDLIRSEVDIFGLPIQNYLIIPYI